MPTATSKLVQALNEMPELVTKLEFAQALHTVLQATGIAHPELETWIQQHSV